MHYQHCRVSAWWGWQSPHEQHHLTSYSSPTYVRETAQCTSCASKTTRSTTSSAELLDGGVGNYLNFALLHLALDASSNSYHQRWFWCEELVVYYFDICSSKPRAKANWKCNSEEIWQYNLVNFLHTGTPLISYAGETAQCTTVQSTTVGYKVVLSTIMAALSQGYFT